MGKTAKVTTKLLQQLRALMNDSGAVGGSPLAAYVVPSADAHNSEYVAPCDERRAYISGFTGSAGLAVITQTEALMWADGRYYIQAAEEMDDNWTLMKQGLPDTPTPWAWLNSNLSRGARIGVDPYLFGADAWNKQQKELKSAGKILAAVHQNLVDLVWSDRPSAPDGKITVLPLEFAGKSVREKVADVREEMAKASADALVVSELDEVAWLLNMRGSDIQYNPVFFAYVIITMSNVEIFLAPTKVNADVEKHLHSELDHVVIKPYGDILSSLKEIARDNGVNVWFSTLASQAIVSVFSDEQTLLKRTPICFMKALKNKVEVQGLINAHVRDGAALCKYLAWLEEQVTSGTRLTEISAADQLAKFRAEQKHFVGLSFSTISSTGPNGAIIHYSPSPETDRPLHVSEIYLVDSGGQYLDGTTDITRTVHFGTPSEYEKECFTRVLKGQMALKNAVFPTKVRGNALDSFARKALWDVGLDYIHGTGHGIGAFLNVHEGPQGITYRDMPDDPGLQENMFVSNEPGYYEAGKFGIRIENIIRVVPADTQYNFASRGFLTFEDVAFAPIDAKLIKVELLTDAELAYLNEYHSKTKQLIGDHLRSMPSSNENSKTLAWLNNATKPLGRQ